MHITFVAGDPGGSRAVLPVVYECAQKGYTCAVIRHGYLGNEIQPCKNIVTVEENDFSPYKTNCLVYGSSSTDTLALNLAKQAKEAKIPTIHICDNWSSYKSRIELNGELLLPDIYCVMNDLAFQDAKDEGIPSDCLAVTGQPALAQAVQNIKKHFQKKATSPFAISENHPVLVFISENYYNVCGPDTSASEHCGFTEYQVLKQLTMALSELAPDAFLYILPHPKHKPNEMEQLWEKINFNLHGKVVRPADPRELFAVANGIVGMASILLYEAWLYGFPTCSLQPNCKLAGLQFYATLDGIFYSASNPPSTNILKNWLSACNNSKRVIQAEQQLHIQATKKITQLIQNLCKTQK